MVSRTIEVDSKNWSVGKSRSFPRHVWRGPIEFLQVRHTTNIVSGMHIEVNLPEDIATRWGTTGQETKARLQLEFAMHLYASRQTSIGRAAEISGVSRGEFEEALNSSKAVRNYDRDDLESDLTWARKNRQNPFSES